MKTRLLILIMLTLALDSHAQDKSSLRLDVDKQLAYCNAKIHWALKELRHEDGSYDYSMEPRNILSSDKQKGWNCRRATADEWCGGFWPGIL